MDKRLAEYIERNKVCPDLIFRDWVAFLELLFECGGFVNEILWFEYVPVNKQKDSLGGGGYVDKENPEYMWAETMIFDDGLANKSFPEIKCYIEDTIVQHNPHDLVPCFYDIGK